MATLKTTPRHRSFDSLSSPFTAVFTSVGVQQNEKALKLAFYNTAALVFVTLSGCAAVAVYYVLEPFLRPLLWASLCGAFLYPFKWKLTQVVRGFLRSLRETNTPLVVGAMVLPFHLANKSSDFVGSLIVQKIRIFITSSLIAVGVYVLYIMQPFNEIVWILKGSGLVVHLLLDFFYNPYLVSILSRVIKPGSYVVFMHLSMSSRQVGRRGIGRDFDIFSKIAVKFPTPGQKCEVKYN